MSKDLLLVVEAVANEKNVEKSLIFDAMALALATATKRLKGADWEVRVDLDRKTGEYQTYRQWTVIADDAEMENPAAQITQSEAREQDPELNEGDVIEALIPSIEFGRIAAQTAKQVIVQKVREAEREKIVAHFQRLLGRLINGTVKRVLKDLIIVDLGGIEGVMPRSEWIPREAFRSGDRIKAHLKDIVREQRGPQLILSRASNEMLIELFKLEIPEVSEEVIQVQAVAREPGSRAKVAVKTNDGRIDPVGACVGMRGTRIQAISNELHGERVDVIVWDDNPAKCVIHAMAPAEIVSILVDEDRHSMDVAVRAEQLSLAIGKNGQNVRLAGKLCGWTLNVMADTDAQTKQAQEQETYQSMFSEHLEIDTDIATLLVNAGFTTLEEVAYVSPTELLSIEGFDDTIVAELQERAKNVLLTQALTGESKLPAPDLLNMVGMDATLAHALAQKGIITMEDLAEQSVDDLVGINGLDEARAGTLIMTARAPWFNADKGEKHA